MKLKNIYKNNNNNDKNKRVMKGFKINKMITLICSTCQSS